MDKVSAVQDSKVIAGSRAANVATYVLIGKILTFIMLGVALILVTRILGPSQYGIYTLAAAFSGIFGALGYFGIGTALNKFISEYTEKNRKEDVDAVVSNSLYAIVASGVAIALLCVLFSSTISQYVFHTTSLTLLVDVIAVYIASVILFGALYDTLLGFGSGKHIAVISVIQAVFQSAISVALALEGLGALAPMIGMVVGAAAGFIAGLYIIVRYNKVKFTRPSGKIIRMILRFGMPVAMSTIVGSLASNVALIFVGYFVLPSIIGNIGITSKTSTLVSILLDSISFALLPAFSAVLVNKKLSRHIGKIYSYAVYLGVALVGPLLFYMAVFSSPFSNFVFGSSYSYAPVYISVMSIGLLLGVAGTYASTLLISLNKVGLVLKYNLLVNFVVLLLILATVPFFGGTLGSISYVLLVFLISPVLTSILLVRRLSDFISIELKLKKLVRLVIADVVVSAAAALLYFALSGVLLLIVAVLAFIVLYPIACVLLRGAERSDIETIRELSKSIPVFGPALKFLMDYAGKAV